MSIILSDYQISAISMIRTNADYGQVAASNDEEGNLVLKYREHGKEMVAVVDDLNKKLHSMLLETYEHPTEPVEEFLANIGVPVEDDPDSGESEVEETTSGEAENEDNEGA